LTEIIQFLKNNYSIKKVKIVCFGNEVFEVYREKLEEINKTFDQSS